jgi:Lrp/AsnC family transcriptional regulator, leucine-responsive regulatory protein
VAADLDPRGRPAHAVGVVDDARREPQDAALHRVEDVRVGVGHPSSVVHADRIALPGRNGSPPDHAQAYDRCVPDLDDVDRQILDLLVQDARRTLADIGERVALSAPAVKRRIDRLEALEVITGYTAVLDHEKLGRPLQAFCQLRFTGPTRVAEIASVAEGLAEVEAVFTTAGDPDALVWIRVRDVADLTRVIDLLRRNPKVTETKTLMVLDVHGRGG